MDYTQARLELLRQAIDNSLPGTNTTAPPETTAGVDPLPQFEDFDTGETLVTKHDADAEAVRRYWHGFHDGRDFERDWNLLAVAGAIGLLVGFAAGICCR